MPRYCALGVRSSRALMKYRHVRPEGGVGLADLTSHIFPKADPKGARRRETPHPCPLSPAGEDWGTPCGPVVAVLVSLPTSALILTSEVPGDA